MLPYMTGRGRKIEALISPCDVFVGQSVIRLWNLQDYNLFHFSPDELYTRRFI
jgi:hypothetical protein